MRKRSKKIVFVDIDGVLANYDLAKIGKTEEERKQKGFFENLPPIAGTSATLGPGSPGSGRSLHLLYPTPGPGLTCRWSRSRRSARAAAAPPASATSTAPSPTACAT